MSVVAYATYGGFHSRKIQIPSFDSTYTGTQVGSESQVSIFVYQRQPVGLHVLRKAADIVQVVSIKSGCLDAVLDRPSKSRSKCGPTHNLATQY